MNRGEQISNFATISLEEMKGIRLMNRIDTKFVTTLDVLSQLLAMAQSEYYVQEIDGKTLMSYYTLYYDTPHCDMYLEHHNGHKSRQKIRMRRYVDSEITFLEVKTKDNHGRTIKKRVQMADGCGLDDCKMFVSENLGYPEESLIPMMENNFHRLTLVNKGKTERLTIDMDIEFHNRVTNETRCLNDLVVIELKRDGRIPSPAIEMLRQLRVHPGSFSKYCMGMAITNHDLKHNRFKLKMHNIDRIMAHGV